jgi:hypothetical protein
LEDIGNIVTESSKLFQRPRGEGWLVLADRPPTLSGEYANLPNALLTNADLSYQPLCILGDEVGISALSDFISDLSVLLDVEVVVGRLEDAKDWDTLAPGILILVGGHAKDWINLLGETNFGLLVLQGFQNGLLLIAIGAAAAALGSWVVEESYETPLPGLNWLVGSIILPWTSDPAEYEVVRSLLARPEPIYAMGLEGGRILALGPVGEVELWGADAPTLVLGAGWRK